MAINTKEFENTKHAGIKRDKKNHHRFLIEYTTKNTDPNAKSDRSRFRKLFNAEQYLGKRESLNSAFNERERIVGEKNKVVATGNDTEANVDDYFELFVETRVHKDTKSKLNPKTIINYKTIYKNHIKDHIGSKKVKDVKDEDISEILSIMKNKEMSVSMVRRVWMTLKFIFELAAKKKIIAESPVEEGHKVKRNVKSEKKPVQNPKQKYKDVHDSILKVFEGQPHNKALFLLGFQGRRRGEALAMEWEHIDFESQTYIIPKEISKIDEDLVFAFGYELKEALLAIRYPHTKGKIFSINGDDVTKLSWKIREDTGIKQFTFHYMRNILVSAFADSMTVPELSALLGHQDVTTINQYLSLPRDEATIKSVDLSKKLLG